MAKEVPHLAQLVSIQAKKYPNKPALWSRDAKTATWNPTLWTELEKRVNIVAKGLYDFGIRQESKFAIYSQNRLESFVIDFAGMKLRAVTVPLYATCSEEQVDFIVNDAGAEMIFVGEQFQYENAYNVVKKGGSLKKIVLLDGSIKTHGEEFSFCFTDLEKIGKTSETDVDEIMKDVPFLDEQLATLIYTSGTTGASKGVMLTYGCYREALRIHDIRLTTLTDADTSLTFLPISHVFERGWCYVCLFQGIEIYVNQNPQDILTAIKEVRPTTMCAVPRFWEKVYIGVKQRIQSYSPIMKGVVTWAIEVGRKYHLDHVRLRKPISFWLKLEYRIAEKFVLSQVKEVLGIENGKIFPVAGSSLSKEILIFLRSIDIPIVYGYGLTETMATVCCFDYYDYNLDSVGSIMPDIQVRIGEDDEILVKGKTVTPGYYNRPEINKESFTEDGFFRTGDAGRLEGNHLILTDRIKDLFKTSNGKYIAPQQIEMGLLADPYIEQIAVIGDKRNYVTAIIAPNMDALKAYAKAENIEYTTIEELIDSKRVYDFYMRRIEEVQKGLAPFEHIKKFTLIKKGFTLEGGELTNTLKLRRTVIAHKYSEIIDKMYLN